MRIILKWLLCLMIVALGVSPSLGKAYTLGDGSEANPYQIVTIQDLKDISLDLSAHYILTKDLDLTDVEWTPLGDESTPFTGLLDGNDHSLSHLTLTKAVSLSIDQTGSTETNNLETSVHGYTGLFGVIDHGQVKNLTLSDAVVDTSEMVTFYGDLDSSFMVNDIQTGLLSGRIVGDGSTPTLENVSVLTSEIKSPALEGFSGYYILSNGVGALASNGADVVLKAIHVQDVKIKGMDASAGFIGSVEGSVSVSDSYFIGEVYGQFDLGAFFGEAEGASDAPYELAFSITHSFANVKLGSLTDQSIDAVGGMVAQLSGYLSASFENVFVRGEIYSENSDDSFVGGLISNTFQIGTLTIHHAYVSVDINLSVGSYPAALFLGCDSGHYDADWNQTGYATLDFSDLHADSTVSDVTVVYGQYDNPNGIVIPFDSPVTYHSSVELQTLAHMLSTSDFDFEEVWVIDVSNNDGFPSFDLIKGTPPSPDPDPLPDTGESAIGLIFLTFGWALFWLSRKPKQNLV